jgi:hypothetical protein
MKKALLLASLLVAGCSIVVIDFSTTSKNTQKDTQKMTVILPQPLRAWNHQPGDTYDLNVLPTNAATRKQRWGRGKEKRVINGMEFAHPNVHGDAILPSAADIMAPDFATKHPATAAGLASLGFAAGQVPSQLDWQDMDIFIEQATYPVYVSYGNWQNYSGDFPVLYRVHMPWHRELLQADQVGMPTQPPPPISTAPQGSELYESGHDISAKLPKGTRIKRAVGSLETAWGAINAMIQQAQEDDVPDSASELMTARGGLLSFFHALRSAFEEGRDFINPAELEECQAACDVYWNSIHAARRVARDDKATGWELVAGDPRQQIYKYSRHNRISWTGLSNMGTAAGLYSIRGETITTGPLKGQRQAEYVDAFVPWDAQDPLDVPVDGSGGINTPNSFES